MATGLGAVNPLIIGVITQFKDKDVDSAEHQEPRCNVVVSSD